jgi:hypothetical protein
LPHAAFRPRLTLRSGAQGLFHLRLPRFVPCGYNKKKSKAKENRQKKQKKNITKERKTKDKKNRNEGRSVRQFLLLTVSASQRDFFLLCLYFSFLCSYPHL